MPGVAALRGDGAGRGVDLVTAAVAQHAVGAAHAAGVSRGAAHVSRLGELGVAERAGTARGGGGKGGGGLTGVPPARRYTGYIPSLEETIGRTPIHAQTEAHQVPSKQANLSVRDTTATGGIDNRNGCAPETLPASP